MVDLREDQGHREKTFGNRFHLASCLERRGETDNHGRQARRDAPVQGLVLGRGWVCRYLNNVTPRVWCVPSPFAARATAAMSRVPCTACCAAESSRGRPVRRALRGMRGSTRHGVSDRPSSTPQSGRLAASDAWSPGSVVGEVKARCGTSFYKNVLYPFVSMYDAEEAHKLSIWVCFCPACMCTRTRARLWDLTPHASSSHTAGGGQRAGTRGQVRGPRAPEDQGLWA